MNDWTYYTNINLNDNNKEDPLIKAYNKFLNELKIDVNIIYKEIKEKGFYKINVDTNNDVINIESKNNYIFLKSKFLRNKKFKQELIDYYNPLKIFVKGPFEMSNNTWSIFLYNLKENEF